MMFLSFTKQHMLLLLALKKTTLNTAFDIVKGLYIGFLLKLLAVIDVCSYVSI